MGDVIQFTRDRRKRSRITFEDFQKSLKSGVVKSRCAEMFAQHGAAMIFSKGVMENVDVTHVETGTGSPDHYKYGLCDALTVNSGVDNGVPTKTKITTIFNEEFPNYVWGQTDLSRTDATEMTAVFALALNGLLSSNALYIPKKRRIVESVKMKRDKNVWDSNRESYVDVVVPATAGYAALAGTEFESIGIDFTDAGPYRSHIAALVDPVSKAHFRQLVQSTIMI